jgi:hypothetical protein
VWEINVSRTGDPVHAGDKALTRETPAERGRVNRYDILLKETKLNHICYHDLLLYFHLCYLFSS